MTTSISTEKHVIVSSGSVITSTSDTVTITIDNEFDIELVLVDDKETTEQRIKGENIPRGAKLSLINFNNPIGTATTEPISIATKKDKTISIALAVHSIGTVRLLQYNVLLEK